MLQPQEIERLISVVSGMDRQSIVEHCLNFHGAFPVDFTPEFLGKMSLERLQHVFVAMCLQSSYVPSESACHAA